MGKLTVRKVETAGPGTYVDGQGLRLIVSASGARKWVFRFMRLGRSREMGLGGSEASLATARERAADARKVLSQGLDPITTARAGKTSRPTFGAVAEEFLASKSAEWRNEKHAAQWASTLSTYCAALWDRPVEELDTPAVLAVLQPIWTRIPETAARVRGRIESVLDAARARGLTDQNAANPARWRGHLDKLLPRRQKLSRGHHAALPFTEIAEFMARLRERNAVAALALEFTILTAARSGEVLGARWSEIDLERAIWTVPAHRMKAGRQHRVPLSEAAAAVLEKARALRAGEFVFPGQRAGRPLSGMAMEMILRRMGRRDVTVHGFRSAFRDWCGEVSPFPREIAEAALAHIGDDATERAYRRGDALAKRRQLMKAWASYCEADGAMVISMRGADGGIR